MDEKADPTDVPRLPGPSVLIVEDEFLIALELEILLAGNGWNVIGPASSVREALFLLQGARPDAAILDVQVQKSRQSMGWGRTPGAQMKVSIARMPSN